MNFVYRVLPLAAGITLLVLATTSCSGGSAPGNDVPVDSNPPAATETTDFVGGDSGFPTQAELDAKPRVELPSATISVADGTPATADYALVDELSSTCEAQLRDLRDFIAENPDPLAFEGDDFAELSTLREQASPSAAQPGCSFEEWAEFNLSELSPWSTGQLAR